MKSRHISVNKYDIERVNELLAARQSFVEQFWALGEDDYWNHAIRFPLWAVKDHESHILIYFDLSRNALSCEKYRLADMEKTSSPFASRGNADDALIKIGFSLCSPSIHFAHSRRFLNVLQREQIKFVHSLLDGKKSMYTMKEHRFRLGEEVHLWSVPHRRIIGYEWSIYSDRSALVIYYQLEKGIGAPMPPIRAYFSISKHLVDQAKRLRPTTKTGVSL